MPQPLVQPNIYTEDDYYNLPENIRAELITGNSTIWLYLTGYIKKY